MTIRNRIARLEAAAKPGRRVFAVRQYLGETTEQALAAEYPGETPAPSDIVVCTIMFTGMTRRQARATGHTDPADDGRVFGSAIRREEQP